MPGMLCQIGAPVEVPIGDFIRVTVSRVLTCLRELLRLRKSCWYTEPQLVIFATKIRLELADCQVEINVSLNDIST